MIALIAHDMENGVRSNYNHARSNWDVPDDIRTTLLVVPLSRK
jgi:hypothetical protein